MQNSIEYACAPVEKSSTMLLAPRARQHSQDSWVYVVGKREGVSSTYLEIHQAIVPVGLTQHGHFGTLVRAGDKGATV
jgi:hypothetical protein